VLRCSLPSIIRITSRDTATIEDKRASPTRVQPFRGFRYAQNSFCSSASALYTRGTGTGVGRPLLIYFNSDEVLNQRVLNLVFLCTRGTSLTYANSRIKLTRHRNSEDKRASPTRLPISRLPLNSADCCSSASVLYIERAYALGSHSCFSVYVWIRDFQRSNMTCTTPCVHNPSEFRDAASHLTSSHLILAIALTRTKRYLWWIDA
jgi:hypothetical protein